VKAKERRNVELKRIITPDLGDGVRPIKEWENILMVSGKALFLQMKSNFVSHMIMEFRVLVIGLL
jgi:hypothetical protein